MKNLSVRYVVFQVAIIVLAFLASYQSAAKPLGVSAVLFHELSHAGVAKALGNEVIRVGVNPEDESGNMKWSGGKSICVVGMAGYLAPVLIGGLLLVGSRRRALGRFACVLVGASAIAAMFLPLDEFAVVYVRWIAGAAAAIFLLAFVAWWMVAVVLRFVGTYWCLYAFFDMLNDCILRKNAKVDGDPADIANALGVDVRIFGVLLFLTVFIIVLVAMVKSVRGDPQRPPFFYPPRADGARYYVQSIKLAGPWYLALST